MKDSPIFELVCDQLESQAGLSRLEARGTIRLLLKELGLDPQRLTKRAAVPAIERCLEQALRVRGLAAPAQATARVLQAVQESDLAGPAGDDPEAIFERIALR